MIRLRQTAAALGIELDDIAIGRFQQYLDLLVTWNQRVNLTAITDPDAIIERHFADALTLINVTGDLADTAMIDIGSGAGLPGIPLKIAFPTMKLTLVDSVGKKTTFMQLVAETLGLENVTVLHDRAEAVGQHPDHREQYEWAVARGVAELRILVEYLLPLTVDGGHVVAQKGASAADEVLAATPAIQALGGGDPSITSVVLTGERQHQLVTIPKVGPTPSNYPRRTGKPSKRPL